jgi:nucleotide-binding universal stress UspA family protein
VSGKATDSIKYMNEVAIMKIVVGYEKNNVSGKTMEMALKHAQAFDGEILLVTSMLGGDKPDKQDIIDVEKNLAQAKKYFNDAGVTCETHLLIRGFETGEDLVIFAKEQNAAEIIIGIKRRSKVGKFIFGSTAQIVILDAHCPVLTVK